MKYITDIENFNSIEYNTFPKSKKKKDCEWDYECDDILTFDTEVSSAWIDENGDVIEYRKGESDSYWNSLTPVSLCYIWQFSFNEQVYYGRKLEDFLLLLEKLPSNVHFIIWVHNLAYDFMFLNNILQPWSTVFSRNAHKPMKAISDKFKNIEFRCSYFLTRLSLDSWGKTLNFEKLHTLNYTTLRTPNTDLSEEELNYCERDCQVIYKGIMKYRDKYTNVYKIPLTQTGEVRQEIKKRIRKDIPVQKQMIKLIPKNAYMYSIMKKTFQGGYTHANFVLAGVTNYNGFAFDFASSYPAVMCSDKFPMTPFTKDIYEEDKTDEFAYLMKVKFDNVEAFTQNHYISLAKSSNISNFKNDNGRIISADTLTLWITEQDLDIILKSYNCSYTILECYRSRKSYLPKVLVEYILELYYNKTCYKGVEGMEDIYAQSKQFINSIFGMSVTDLLQDEVMFNGNDWWVEEKTTNDVEVFLTELREDNKGRTFMAYQFGCWITAYARHNLWECILSCDEDVIYCDTDSLKLKEKHDFSWYNAKVTNKLKLACETLKIDFETTRPTDPAGKKHPLGVFEEEDEWSEFKTLGAKRYCYRTKKDGKLHITISGINKEAVECLNDDIENFTEETMFDKDEDCVTKKYSIYCNSQPTVVWNKGKNDEFESKYLYGINMRAMGYSMGLLDEYLKLINSVTSTNYLLSV